MDPKRFKETYGRLELLDDRLTYRIRSRSVKSRQAPTLELLDDRLRNLADFTLELKDIDRELMVAMASKPQE